jgi:hypothetical protein
MLWSMAGQGAAASVTDSLALRQQALGFVDFALAGQPATVEGGLLRQLRKRGSLLLWLRVALGERAAEAAPGWRAAALGQWPAAPQSSYAGQVLVCGERALVLGRAGLQSVSAHPQGQQFVAAELSPDGGTLAALILARSTTKLVLFDLVHGTLEPLPVAQPATLLGWRPSGELLYLEVHPDNGPSSVWRLMRLRQYDPASDAFTTVLSEPVVLPWSERTLWSPDRRSLSLALYVGGLEAQALSRLALVTPGTGRQVGLRLLPTPGYAPAYSPAGDRLAVFSGGDPFLGTNDADGWRLNLIDLRHRGQLMTVLTAAGVEAWDFSQVGALDWSPDGRWLTFMRVGSGGGPESYLVPAEGGRARSLDVGVRNAGSFALGFSADSRYVAVTVIGGLAGTNEIVVFDLAAPAKAAPQRYLAQTAAWSGEGHRLLMGGPAGVYDVDPATGKFSWLYDSTCSAESGM